MQWIGRFARRLGVGAGSSAGALAGACLGLWFGLYLGALAYLAAWRLGHSDAGFFLGIFLILPLSLLAGAFLGARLFLRFRASATALRQRHRRLGGLAWALGSILLMLAGLFALAIFFFVVGSVV